MTDYVTWDSLLDHRLSVSSSFVVKVMSAGMNKNYLIVKKSSTWYVKTKLREKHKSLRNSSSKVGLSWEGQPNTLIQWVTCICKLQNHQLLLIYKSSNPNKLRQIRHMWQVANRTGRQRAEQCKLNKHVSSNWDASSWIRFINTIEVYATNLPSAFHW